MPVQQTIAMSGSGAAKSSGGSGKELLKEYIKSKSIDTKRPLLPAITPMTRNNDSRQMTQADYLELCK